MSKLKVRCYPVKTLVWIVRGSPLMIQLLIVYYGLPIVFGIPPRPVFLAALIAFVFNYCLLFLRDLPWRHRSHPQGTV